MVEKKWKIISGSYDPYRNTGQISVQPPAGGLIQVTGVTMDLIPSGENAQQQRLRQEVVTRLREAADYLESVQTGPSRPE